MCEGGMQASVFLNSPGDCNRQLSKSVNHWLYKPNDELILFFYSFVWPHCAACGVLVPRPRFKPRPSAVTAQSPNHWTTREVPPVFLSFKPASDQHWLGIYPAAVALLSTSISLFYIYDIDVNKKTNSPTSNSVHSIQWIRPVSI